MAATYKLHHPATILTQPTPPGLTELCLALPTPTPALRVVRRATGVLSAPTRVHVMWAALLVTRRGPKMGLQRQKQYIPANSGGRWDSATGCAM